ncbi:hypothetical protein PVAG01_06634 [Phlyctema vagabunda]|uniref:DUF7908 domain-containing protein n=1 Tax=Phlyctema vagabunda TaxID=108571 RepID=A0ABR4PGN1_9HELO
MLFHSLITGGLVLSLSSNAHSLELEKRQANCTNRTLEVEYPILTHYPVVINQYFDANTIININGGVQININNAPTFLSTVVTATASATSTLTTNVRVTSTQVISATVTATSTFTSTATGIVSSALAEATSSAAPFVIEIDIPSAKARRQKDIDNLYLTSSGLVVKDNFQASIFKIISEQLVSDELPIAVNYPGNASAIFQASSSGAISTSFVSSGDGLSWINLAFSGGEAVFCLLGDTIRVVFDGSSVDNCIAVTLGIRPVPTGSPSSSSLSSPSTGDVSTQTTATSKESNSISLIISTVTGPSGFSSVITASLTISSSSLPISTSGIPILSVTSTSSEPLSTSTDDAATVSSVSSTQDTPSSTLDFSSSSTSSSTEDSSASPSQTLGACPETQIFCDGACVNQTISNCGTCGNSCLGYSSFYGQPYVCDTSTGSIENGVPGGCASVSPRGCFPCTDECNCGSEPGVCTPGGYCIYEYDDEINCGTIGNVCKAPYDTCHRGSCVDLQNDPNNCGLAGLVCAEDASVVQNSCVNGQCVSLSDNADNCGAIGNKCPGATPQCVNSSCIDLSTDTSNCGYIGYQCNANETCQNGMCSCGTVAGCGGGGTCLTTTTPFSCQQ